MDNDELRSEILRLKQEKNAVILAHYYQRPEIQDIADMIGDSFALAQRARDTDAELIVLSGVSFMAETAKIVSPGKTVLLPDEHAGCPLADSAPYDEFVQFRLENPDHLAITYINSSTEVKAASDIICTSSSAKRIVEAIPSETPILFAPDENLGTYLKKELDRDMLLWPGGCIVHLRFNPELIKQMKDDYPDAPLAAHPECNDDVLKLADYIGSTSGILNFVSVNDAESFIIATEPGIIHQMELANPDKRYIPAPAERMHGGSVCMNMKKNTLQKIHSCLSNSQPEVVIEESLRLKAAKSLERMLLLNSENAANSRKIVEGIRLPFTLESLN
jgi:quinolinate synthase